MNKILPVLLIVAIIAATWFFMGSGEEAQENIAKNTTTTTTQTSGLQTGTKSPDGSGTGSAGLETHDMDEDDDLDLEFDDRPATEIYNNETDALAALEKGALDYDDLILEQFTELGSDCTWCDALYEKVTERMLSEGLDEDSKSYYAEVLAISGRVDNVKTLVDAIQAQDEDSDEADIFAEALEYTIGGDDVVNYLSDYLETDNELLQESSVAAITNQGSRLAAELLYSHTVKTGDSDGYYSIGIGLGELIPETETLPYLQERAMEKDAYSHLAVKALLNEGMSGLRIVFDVLSNSDDPDFDRKMLEDAVDHVSYEDDIESYLNRIKDGSDKPVVKEFAQEILDDFNLDEEDEDFDEDEEEL